MDVPMYFYPTIKDLSFEEKKHFLTNVRCSLIGDRKDCQDHIRLIDYSMLVLQESIDFLFKNCVDIILPDLEFRNEKVFILYKNYLDESRAVQICISKEHDIITEIIDSKLGVGKRELSWAFNWLTGNTKGDL